MMCKRIFAIAFLAFATAACGEVTVGGADAPEIESFAPEHSSSLGGTNVTLTGVGFNDGSETASVLVGGILATNVVVVDDGTVTFDSPANEPGTEANVVLFNGDGTGRSLTPLLYSNPPKVFSISPTFGPAIGGTVLTVTGVGFENFDPGTNTVSIGSSEAAAITVVSDTELSVTTAASLDSGFSSVDITVGNTNGTGVLAGKYKFTKQGILLTKRLSDNPSLNFLDLDTLEVAEIAPMSVGLSAMAIHPDGTVYGSTNQDQKNLVTLDPLTGVTTAIGPIRRAGNQTEMPADLIFVGSTLFGISPRFSRRLFTIDLGTAAATEIGATPLAINRSPCIENIDDANFHMINQLSGPLSTISTVDSTLTATGLTLTGPANTGCHGMLTIDGTTYVMSARPSSGQFATIYTLNIASGTLTELVQLPFLATGMSITPSNF